MVDVRRVRLHVFDVLDVRRPPLPGDAPQHAGNAICRVSGPGPPRLLVSRLPFQGDVIVSGDSGCAWERRGDVLVNVQNAAGCPFQQATGDGPAVLGARYEAQIDAVSDVIQLKLGGGRKTQYVNVTHKNSDQNN